MPNEESMLALVHQCAHHGWYKMLSALVISLNQRNPDHGVFGFLTCFFNPNFTIDKIKSYFSEKSVFEWLNTQSAQVIIKYILEDSRHYYYRLNDLLNDMIHTAHEIKPDNENTQKAVLADIKGQINRKTKSTLNQISKKILVHANHLDKTPIENIYALIDVKGVSNIPPKKKKPIPDKKRIKVPAKKIIVKTPKQKADQPGKQMNFFDMIDN